MKEAKYTKSMTFAVSEEDYQKITEISDKKKISKGEYLRGIFEKELSSEKEEKE